MGDVRSLGRSPGEWVSQEIKGMRLRSCVVVYQQEDGQYGSADAGMTPEQMLMAAEILRNAAMQIVCGDDE